ncbi:MAG TPA: thioredoxin domain-containing protein [Woeseiaceae bacterium]|nr:thioredoxin domain-containing protein [Woeseiaceae bacterium]
MKHSNRLAHETSPYLRQHAANPVDWHPWSEEALALAREEGKPILLSIGYSACHWCHVMAHESFEDEQTAELMNRLFVNVKVDREERPDIDRIYQTAHQLLTQRPGGWPLTMFLDPEDQRPFFGGTYFPDEPRYGMPAFRQLIARVRDYYDENRDEVREQGLRLEGVLRQLSPRTAGDVSLLSDKLLTAARDAMARAFDPEFGGFGGAPKFPQPSGLERLLRQWQASTARGETDSEALEMVALTLRRMAEGGLQDHLGGGFYRYSVDRSWHIPHFEKMLYDNGPLLALYAEAHLAIGEPVFRQAAVACAEWLLADMRSPEGGFYASRDADSQGEEGRYYVWTPDEAQAVLPPEEYRAFACRFGLDGEPNFEGKWHLVVRAPLAETAAALETTEEELKTLLEGARQRLLEVRSRRVPPGRDEKQLASWNALAIRGLVIAGRALDRAELVGAAAAAADFVSDRLMRDGRLLASYKDGAARFPAYLDDHAFLLDALLELLQADWQTSRLDVAVTLADALLEHFYDEESGGFYFTADDHEPLIHRPKPLADESMPSGNGVAARALQRLGFLLGDVRYLQAAENTLRYAAQAMAEFPHAHMTLLTALEEYLEHPEIVIVRGHADEIASWRAALSKRYAPRRLVMAIPADCENLPGALAERTARAGETVAYRCVGSTCSLPITSLEALLTSNPTAAC